MATTATVMVDTMALAPSCDTSLLNSPLAARGLLASVSFVIGLQRLLELQHPFNT
jgi:hypothetical protein